METNFNCIFLCYWEIYRETHAFPMWWSISYDENRIGKKHSYYGKSTTTNFPGSPHQMDFVAFSHTMDNWWKNPCIFHLMRSVNFFQCYISCVSNKINFKKHLLMPTFDVRKTKKKQNTIFMQVAADTLYQSRTEYIPWSIINILW